MSETKSPIRCAIVGLRQGLENVYVVLNHPSFELACLCDTDREPYSWITGETRFEDSTDQYAGAKHLQPMVKAIREHPAARGTTFTESFEEVLRDDRIDAVILVVPDRLHDSICVAALEAGKSVLLTKPISNTLSGARSILDAAASARTRFMLGFQLSYSRFASEVRSIIESGRIGDVRQIVYHFHRAPFFRPFNRSKAVSGGALIQEGCHYFDLFHRFTGLSFTSVYGRGGLDKLGDVQDIQDNGTILVELEGGLQCVFLFSYFRGNPLRDSVTVLGTEGTISGTMDAIHWEIGSESGRQVFENHRLPHLNHEGYYEMHDAFAEMIATGIEPYAGWETSRENALLSHGAQRSLDSRVIVTRDEMLTELEGNA